MSDLQREVNQLRGVLASLIEDKLERVTRSLERMGVAASPYRTTPTATSSDCPTPTATPAAGATATATAATSLFGADATATVASALSPNASAQGLTLVRAHVHDNSQRPAPMELKGAGAGDFYKNLMARGGQVPAGLSDQDKGRVRQLMFWFNAMANQDEKALLLPAKAGCVMPDEGERREVAANLHMLVVERMKEAFLEHGHETPPPALAKGTLPATAISDRIAQLKKVEGGKTSVTVITNWEAFTLWRMEHEEKAKQARVQPMAKRARPA